LIDSADIRRVAKLFTYYVGSTQHYVGDWSHGNIVLYYDIIRCANRRTACYNSSKTENEIKRLAIKPHLSIIIIIPPGQVFVFSLLQLRVAVILRSSNIILLQHNNVPRRNLIRGNNSITRGASGLQLGSQWIGRISGIICRAANSCYYIRKYLQRIIICASLTRRRRHGRNANVFFMSVIVYLQ